MKKRYARILAATLSAAMVFTSAPTAAFATELSVSEDAVEAEGVDAVLSDVEALFPKTIETKYHSGELTYAMTAGGAKTSKDVSTWENDLKTDDVKAASITGAANIATMDVGETAKVKITLTMKGEGDSPTKDWSGVVDDVKTMTIAREYTVACVKTDDVNADPETQLGTLPTASAEYGTGKVKLSAETAWKVVDGSVKAEVATADQGAVVTKGVKVASVKKYDSALYDIDAILKLSNWKNVYTYNSATQSFETYIDVTVGKAKVYASKLNSWPSALVKGSTIEIDTDVTALELVGKDAKEGTYTVTKISAIDYDANSTGAATTTATKLGKQYLTVQFAEGANYDVVENDPANKNKDIDDSTAGKITYSDLIEVNVVKKTVTEADCQPKMKKTSVDLGTDYDTILSSCVNANEFVNYSLRDVTGTDIPAVGSYTIALNATLKDSAKVQIGAGKNKTIVYITVNVKAPEVKVALNTTNNNFETPQGDKADNGVDTDVYANVKLGSYIETVVNNKYTVTAQLYANGAKTGAAVPYNVTQAAQTGSAGKFTIASATSVGTTEYYVEIVLTAKTTGGPTDAEKAAVEAVVPGLKLTTQKFSITKSTVEVTPGADITTGKYAYGYTDTIKSTATVDYQTTGSGYSLKDLEVVLKDAKGAEVQKITNLTKTTDNYGNLTIEALLPSGLNAGTYFVTYQVTSKKDATSDDFAVATQSVVIDKKAVTVTNANLKTEKESYPYGTKLSDIKLISTAEGCTIAWSTENVEYPTVADGAANATFAIETTQTEEQKKNYTITPLSVYTVPAGKPMIKKADLSITVDPIELKVGDKLPAIASVKPSVKGIVAKDKFNELGVTVELKYAAGIENSIAKAGSYVDAVEVTAKLGANIIDNNTYKLDNYTVKVTDGTVVVKEAAAPTTPPTVAPTPAPVKQAVAAAPKAAKAKVSVKAGKKYTLKLKYAAGKKATVKSVTWKSSKKSVATVSSKGKVTAVKAGKATIAATITFKDGSKKKVKFTVTVK